MFNRWGQRLSAAAVGLAVLGATHSAHAAANDAFALQFDGSSTYVTMGQAPTLGATAFTLETWFVRKGTGSASSSGSGGVSGIPLIAKGRGEADGNNRDCNYFFAIRSSDNVLAADFEDTASGLNHPVAGVTAIENDRWYHAAATYDGTTWRLYLDGQLETELTVNATPRGDSIQHFGLATALNSSGSREGTFNGLLDEVRVWDHARTQLEIMNAMHTEISSAPGLLGRWDLNENTGSVAHDSTGNGNAGSIVGASWVHGIDFDGLGGGMLLDGSNDHIAMGQAPGLGSATFTLEGWFRRLGAGDTTSSGAGGVTAEPLIAKGRGEADGNNRDCNYFFGLRNTDQVLVADFEDMASGLNHPIVGVTPVTDDDWHHAAATYDGATWRLYLDGVLDAELTVNATPRADSIQHFAIGAALTSTGARDGAFNGVMDEVRVWDYARSDVEIMDGMDTPIVSAPGLLGAWDFETGAGATAVDTSGNGNDGAVLGGVWVQGRIFGDFLTVVTQDGVVLSESSAQLNGELLNLGDDASVDAFFRWGDSPATLTQTTAPQTLGAPGAFSATLTNLPEDSIVYFQAVADGAIDSDEGAVQSVVVTENFGLHFNGAADRVTMGAAPGLGSETFTLETWFKRTGAGQTSNTGSGGVFAIPLVTKGRGEVDGSNLDMNYFLGIRSSDNVLAADFEDTASGLNHPVAGVTAIENDRWYHAAATYDGTMWRLYLNGVLDAELAVNATPRGDSLQHFGLGTAMTSTGSPEGALDGVLDEVRVWDHARTQQEIRDAINLQIETAPGLLGRWGMNEGSGAMINDATGNGNAGTVLGAAWDFGAPFNISLPPAMPMLISPADAGDAYSADVELIVNVSDPDVDDVDVTFYGRPISDVAGEPFTIVPLPDTQFYSQTYPQIFTAQTQWIADHVNDMNIAFVPHLGDIVQSGNVAGEWDNADAAISILENVTGLPFVLCVGNHDQAPGGDPNGTATFNQYFPFSRFASAAWYGGHYGADNDNHFVLFSAGGMDFICVCLEYDTSAEPAVLAWADSVLATHADRRAIIVSHYIIGTGNPGSFGSQGAAIYNALKDNDNIFLMLCGHVTGEGRRTDVFNGNTIHTLLADYQGRANGGDGWLRIMEFVPADNEIRVSTYSPTLDQYETDGDSEFTIAYNMSGTSFVELGTVTGVTSGGDATFTWEGLDADAAYEWFAVVSDGGSQTQGPTWSFTVTPCTADFTGPEGTADGMVGTGDFFALLQHWGDCPAAPDPCPWDITGDGDAPDGVVGTADFFLLLQNWGPCD
jgi:hypothetical protein